MRLNLEEIRWFFIKKEKYHLNSFTRRFESGRWKSNILTYTPQLRQAQLLRPNKTLATAGQVYSFLVLPYSPNPFTSPHARTHAGGVERCPLRISIQASGHMAWATGGHFPVGGRLDSGMDRHRCIARRRHRFWPPHFFSFQFRPSSRVSHPISALSVPSLYC
jgi:hypothetical protein